MMFRALAVAAIALTVLVAGGAAADTFSLTVASQTNNTITFSYPQQTGYGYLYSADGVLRSRTNDPTVTTVKFSKQYSTFEVAAIVKGATGTYPSTPPPSPPTATFTISPNPAAVGQSVTFDWTGTCPAGGCTLVWEDEGPDGPGGTDYTWGSGDPFQMAFAATGTKYAHLVVTDSTGATAESRQQLTVVSSPPPTTQCSDGVDNADPEDTLVDLADPGCVNASDNDETDPAPLAQCADGADNDGDSLVDLADPGCSSSTDNDETNVVSGTCDLNATTSTFAAQVNAATAGQTVCLASGNYGTWSGTNKAITVRAASGASPQMQVNFVSGDSGFTLDGMTGMGGSIGGASNVTVRNSVFTAILVVEGPNVNVVLDGNTHNWPTSGTTGPNSKIGLGGGNGTLANPSVTIRNSQFKNGDLDGIFIGGGSGYLIQNNVFDNLCDTGVNHTDQIQFADVSPAITQTRIIGNYAHAPLGCGTQGITSFDHGTNGVIIENNVVDIHRPWGIELYSDVNSIVRHNTVVYYPDSECDFTTITCGKIALDHKSGDPQGVGTQVYDNLAVPDFDSPSSGTAHHNVTSQGAVYVGPLTFHDGYLLAASSPVGKGAASDGTDAGVYPAG